MSSSIIKQYQNGVNKVSSKDEYLKIIQSDKVGVRRGKTAAVNHFDRFAVEKLDQVSSDSIVLEMLENPEMTEGLFGLLHDFVQYLDGKISPSTLPIYLFYLRKYLYARGIKIDVRELNDYFKKNNTMKKVLKERKYTIKLSEIQSIINAVDIHHKRLYLTLLSSGIRIGEALKIRKSDIDFSNDRPVITIRSEIAKNSEERITIMSEECHEVCKKLFETLQVNDLVFGSDTCLFESNLTNHELYFARVRERLGLTEQYKSGTHKITLHTFRSFFISKIIKENENLGHYLAGHSVYMKQYERFETEELIEAYIKSEPELTIIDLTRKDNEIKDLKNNNLKYQELNIKIELYQKLILSLGIDPKVLEQKARELSEE